MCFCNRRFYERTRARAQKKPAKREKQPKPAKNAIPKNARICAIFAVHKLVRQNPRKQRNVHPLESFDAEPWVLEQNPLTANVGKISEKHGQSRRSRKNDRKRVLGDCENGRGFPNVSGFFATFALRQQKIMP